jgi:hypothetical protein
LRELHDATADFTPPANAVWQVEPVPAALGGSRIIHRDVAAWNLLEKGGVITGLADWDLAGPGRLIEDFAYVAWHFTPLHPELMGDGSAGPPVADRPRRLRLLADAYGLSADERHQVLSEVAAFEVRQPARVADGSLAEDQAPPASGEQAASPRTPADPSPGSLRTVKTSSKPSVKEVRRTRTKDRRSSDASPVQRRNTATASAASGQVGLLSTVNLRQRP